MRGNSSVPPEGAGVPRTSAAPRRAVGSDSYTGSSAAQSVADKVEQLKADADSDIRADLVLKFRALMGSGTLDTQEAAGRAADAMLRG